MESRGAHIFAYSEEALSLIMEEEEAGSTLLLASLDAIRISIWSTEATIHAVVLVVASLWRAHRWR